MVASISMRLMLFLSSYSPLFIILGVRSWLVNPVVGDVFFVIAAVSVGALALFLRLIGQFEHHNVKILQSATRDAEMTSYIVTYLLPFLAVSYSDLGIILSLSIMLGVIAIVYVQSNMVYINPILNILGYHIFEVQTDDGKLSALVSKNRYVRTGSTIEVVSLGDYVMLEMKP